MAAELKLKQEPVPPAAAAFCNESVYAALRDTLHQQGFIPDTYVLIDFYPGAALRPQYSERLNSWIWTADMLACMRYQDGTQNFIRAVPLECTLPKVLQMADGTYRAITEEEYRNVV